MAASEWHSTRSDVYHNTDRCHNGNNIEKRYLRPGRGGRTLCKTCRALARKR